MKIVFTSDLHGNTGHYRKLFEHSASVDADAIIIGGDLSPKENMFFGTPEGHKKYLEETLFKMIEDYKSGSKDTEIFIMMGNDDWKCNMDLLEAEEGRLFKLMHDKIQRLADGWSIVGYSTVNVTPFRIKDWELWDNKTRTEKIDRTIGFVSDNGKLKEIELDPDRPVTIEDELDALAKRVNGVGKLIFVSHAPPFGTGLDKMLAGFDVGCMSVKRFIERAKPEISLHGHIHEAPYIHRKFRTKIRDCLSVNPGQMPDDLHCVTFDLDDPEGSIIHSLFNKDSDYDRLKK